MTIPTKPASKAHIRLREESDDWVILFDPDTAHARVLNPVGVFVWKLLDGNHGTQEIVDKLRAHYDKVPEEAEQQVTEFIEVLIKTGFVSDGN